MANLGVLNGVWADYTIINTQYVSGASSYVYFSVNPAGCFYAPPEATHALITACAQGGNPGNQGAGGGGAAACFRVSFPITPKIRWIPYWLGTKLYWYSVGVNLMIGSIGSNYESQYGGLGDNSELNLGLTLGPGGAGSGSTGGAGGSLSVYQRSTNTATPTTKYLLSGGAGSNTGGTPGGNGNVMTLPDGGIIASGAGGGGGSTTPFSRGGDVFSPLRNSYGGRYTDVAGGGGASLFADGISTYGTSGGAPSTYAGKFADYYGYQCMVGSPGAGAPGTSGYSAPSPYAIGALNYFIYCEFIAPR
jgi:hypothetical protein